MSTVIKYKGSTIATVDADATKVLKTGGKYCEGDITVENMRDGNPNSRKYIVTVDSDQTGTFQLTTITDSDVLYLLKHTFRPEKYPVNQPCDYNGDGEITDADAVYLLKHIFRPEKYPLTK